MTRPREVVSQSFRNSLSANTRMTVALMSTVTGIQADARAHHRRFLTMWSTRLQHGRQSDFLPERWKRRHGDRRQGLASVSSYSVSRIDVHLMEYSFRHVRTN